MRTRWPSLWIDIFDKVIGFTSAELAIRGEKKITINVSAARRSFTM